MKPKRFEVAVAFTDGTWESTITEVEDFPEDEAEKVAEEKVLEDYMGSDRAVSFTKVIWEDPEEEI